MGEKQVVGQSRLLKADFPALLANLPSTGRVAEIGTWQGNSVARLARSRPDLEFVCIDTFAVLPEYDQLQERKPAQRMALWFENKRPNMTLFVGDTSKWSELRLGGWFGLIIIDGEHSRAAVRQDMCWASEHLTNDGRILLHDWKREVIRAGFSDCGAAEITGTPSGWGLAQLKCEYRRGRQLEDR